uniref:Protein FAR1-RELATED SEQUENCE n=1 Tax=Lactuca sativa TaxID=4236 RepID=A0A9R1V120_LACSA|nr:hypothetical protein LSAT_V11C700355760 [Lactuca sativa]
MDDQVSDVNNHIYEEHYFASDDEDELEVFDFPGNDKLYNGGFQIGESRNPNVEDAEDAEDKIQFIDEDTDVNIDFSKGQSHVTHDYVSPGGTLYWTLIVSNNIKPKVTSKYDSYDETITMYRNYALESSLDRDCKTKVVLDIILCTLKYIVSNFVEQHNHELFSKGNMYLSRTKRKLDYSQEIFVHYLSKQNIGPVKAHRSYTALQGGPSVRGEMVSDFKNARRNLNCYICGRDAKFLVDKMSDRKKHVPTFTFEYKVLKKRLNALFWADETTKYNYNSFGDVSLDATFNMNKYI